MIKATKVFWLLALSLLLASCAMTMPESFYNNSPAEWTQEQKLVAFYAALQKWGTVETPDGRKINRELLSVYDVYDTVLRLKEDLSAFLQIPQWLEFVHWKGSTPAVFQTDAIITVLSRCMTAYKIQSDLAGIFSLDRTKLVTPTDKYSTRLIMLCPQLSKLLKLDEPSIQKAKEEQRLLPTRIYRVALNTEYGEKELEVRNYKILPDTPFANEEERMKFNFSSGDYIEVAYTDQPDTPILRAYRSKNDEHPSVLVEDFDSPDAYGFGLPDKVENYVLLDGMEWIASHLQEIFSANTAQISLYKEKKPIETYIVKAGEKVQTWEDGTFEVPYSYKSEQSIANYVEDEEAEKARTDKAKVIKYYKSKYTDVFVEEIYVPKKEFAVIKNIDVYNDKLKVSPFGSATVEAEPEYFGKLTYVVYKENNTSWMLWDSKGTGKFDKRRQVNWSW